MVFTITSKVEPGMELGWSCGGDHGGWQREPLERRYHGGAFSWGIIKRTIRSSHNSCALWPFDSNGSTFDCT